MRQHLEQTVVGMVRIVHDTTGFVDTALIVQGLDWGEIASTDAFGCPHNPLQGLAIEVSAAAIPGSEAASQDALLGVSVESSEDFGTHASFPQFPEKGVVVLSLPPALSALPR